MRFFTESCIDLSFKLALLAYLPIPLTLLTVFRICLAVFIFQRGENWQGGSREKE